MGNLIGISPETIRATALLSDNVYNTKTTTPIHQNQFTYEDEVYSIKRFVHPPDVDATESSTPAKTVTIPTSTSTKGLVDTIYNSSFVQSFMDVLGDAGEVLEYIDYFEQDTMIDYACNENSKTVFLAVRGTDSKANMLFTDADIEHTEYEDTGTTVFAGWYNYMRAGLNSTINDGDGLTLDETLEKDALAGYTFIVTGHSLGAAVAPLLAIYLNCKFNVPGDDITLITYAASPVYLFNFVKKFQTLISKNIRFHNIGDSDKYLQVIGDPVVSSALPLEGHHFGCGQVVSLAAYPNGGLAGLVDNEFMEKHLGGVDSQLYKDVKYVLSLHAMDNYKDYILDTYIPEELDTKLTNPFWTTTPVSK